MERHLFLIALVILTLGFAANAAEQPPSKQPRHVKRIKHGPVRRDDDDGGDSGDGGDGGGDSGGDPSGGDSGSGDPGGDAGSGDNGGIDNSGGDTGGSVDSPNDPGTTDPGSSDPGGGIYNTPSDNSGDCGCIGTDVGDFGGGDSGGGGDTGGGSTPATPLPPQVSNAALFTFSIKPGHEQNSRFNIKLSLPRWSNALMTPAIFQSSLQTLTLTIGSASFSGDIGAHGRVSFFNGQSADKGQVNPGRNLTLNLKGLNLIELLSLDPSAFGPQTTVENISLTATDLAGETITFYNAATVFTYSVTKQGIKGVASGS